MVLKANSTDELTKKVKELVDKYGADALISTIEEIKEEM